MEATILKPIKVRSTGETFLPGQVVDLSEEKIREWGSRGLVQAEILAELKEQPSAKPPSCPDEASGRAYLPEALKTQGTGIARWDSPLFGRLEGGPVLEQGPNTFTLRHPLTQEIVELPNEWLVSMDERSAILEYDAGLSREGADRQAKIEFFGLFRKGGSHENRA